MERRHFLKIAIGFAAGAATLAAAAEAAPLSPQPLAKDERLPSGHDDVHPAVTSEAEVGRLAPEQVHWGHRGHGHRWGRHHHHRHWGWRHRHWRRHWRRWHRRYW